MGVVEGVRGEAQVWVVCVGVKASGTCGRSLERKPGGCCAYEFLLTRRSGGMRAVVQFALWV